MYIGVDIFGAVYFFLTLYNELAEHKTDRHGRKLLSNTWLRKNRLQHRPIVNEYADLLRGALSFIGCQLRPKMRSFEIEVSCDVDRLYACHKQHIKWLFREMALTIFRERKLIRCVNLLLSSKLIGLQMTPFTEI